MDAAVIALHIAYHSKSAFDAIIKAVSWGGDSDSVAAVVGAIVGPMYGIEK
jgi:ADP-ribosylglycohydrolase